MAYAGLATGAGGAAGLETLFARMRAEEALANQGRSIDIDKFNAESTDTNRRGVLAENTRQFNEEAPLRGAQTTADIAGARENNANAGILEERGNVLRGLRPILGNAGPGSGGTSSGVASGGGDALGGMDNPAGRLRLSVAGIPPSGVFENDTNGEDTLDAYAVKVLGPGHTRHELTFDQRNDALKADPRFGQANIRIGLAEQGMGIRTSESALRKRKMELDIRSAEQRLNELPQLQRSMALAEFRNRMQNDVTTKQTWTQWLNGEDLADPSAQIDQIAADVLSKYPVTPAAGTGTGRGAGAGTQATPATPAAGSDDLDAIINSRRQARPQQ